MSVKFHRLSKSIFSLDFFLMLKLCVYTIVKNNVLYEQMPLIAKPGSRVR